MRTALFLSLLSIIGLSSCSSGEKKAVKPKMTIDKLFKLYPDSLPIIIEHGNVMIERYDYDRAMQDGAKAFRLDSNNIEARFLYATALNNRAQRSVEDVLNAQRHFRVIVNKQPKNTKALVALGSTYAQQGDFKNGFSYINEALRVDKHFRDAYVMKGSMYLTMGKRDLAKSSYQTAIEQDPNFFEAYIFLGDIYMNEGNPVCVEYYKTATELRPNSIDALYSLAYGFEETNQPEASLETYRIINKKDDDFTPAYFHQGRIKQFMQNQPDSAIYFYNVTLAKEPRFVEAWHNLGLVYEDKGDRPKALDCYSKALKYDPEFKLSRDAANRLR